ncbi:hypothetical protein AB0N09_41990 [Streptomyces erythrochromogenes]|uniref:hypothetical protein n=1 Tax=Streptomyces erythrochromogenes TaxID=285574 RepID=UPI003420C6FE
MTITTLAWSWAVTVTAPGGQPVPAIAFEAFTDQEAARERAATFVTTLGEDTGHEDDARHVAQALSTVTGPDTTAAAHSAYAGICSAHIFPVAPRQSPQQAWEQHMPAIFANRIGQAWTWVVAQVDGNDARVVAGGGPFPTDRNQAEEALIGALSLVQHPDATALAERWSSNMSKPGPFSHGLYTAALVLVAEGLAANAEDAVHDALTEHYETVTYR